MANKTAKGLTFIFGADLKGFDQAMKKAERNVKKFGKKMQGIGRGLTTSVTLPILGVGAASVKMASDFEESLNKVRVSFESSSQIVEDFAKTTLQSFGIAEGSALEMAALFGDMGTSLGLTTDEAAEMSTTLVGLAGDLASFKNVGIDVAQTGLAGIFTGETESLKKMGIMINEATLKNSDYFLSLQTSWKELTNLEKIQIRYNEVLRQSSKAMGDFERTGDSFANQMRKLQETLKETGAELGKELIPIATDLVKILTNWVQKLNDLDNEQRQQIIRWGGIAAALGPVVELFANLVLSLTTIVFALPKITKFFGKLVGRFNILGLLATTVAGGIFEMVSGMRELTDLEKNIAKGPTTPSHDRSKDPLLKNIIEHGKLVPPDADDKTPSANGHKMNMTIIPLERIKPIQLINKELEDTIKLLPQVTIEYKKWTETFSGENHILAREFSNTFESSLTRAMLSQENFFKSFIANIKQAITQMIALHAAQFITNQLFGNLTGNFTGANIFTTILGFANGGLVSGPTLSMVGEGSGTSLSNPEVVAPLDKLKQYIGGGSQNITVTGRLVGNDIWLSNSKTNIQRQRAV
jgi:hypothetical protein